MVSAILYLQWHSLKNRTVMRLKRLKQPKYLLGGIVGALYFYFYFFKNALGMGKRGGAAVAALSPEDQLLWESAGALAFFIFVLVAWLVPRERAALAFTESEVAFLFPAPISRRGLIHFKLIRSQLAILFSTVVLTLVWPRSGREFWIRGVGWWLILSTLNLHLLGSSFARTMLLDRGITPWKRRLWICGLLLVSGSLVLIWGARTLPGLALEQLDSITAVKGYLQRLLTSGPLPLLLYPFRLVVRPYLALNGLAFLSALPAALALLALHYCWVIRSNVAFEEASVEASRKTAEKLAAIRGGHWRAAGGQRKGRRAPFRLGPVGPPSVAFLWKNLIGAGHAFTLRTWLMLAALGVTISLGLMQANRSQDLLTVLGMVAGMLLAWSLLLGPQVLRQDFRQDLPLAEVLKVYPLRGWQLALGELLAPAVILTAIQWVLLLVIVVAVAPMKKAGLGWPGNFGIAVAMALLLPLLDCLTLLIPNAAVLLFPAWFQAGKEGTQGIEAMGQRIILMLGQVLVFAVTLVPVAIVFGAVLFLLNLVLSFGLAIPLASVASAVVLGVEIALGVRLLGWLFERFDVADDPAGR